VLLALLPAAARSKQAKASPARSRPAFALPSAIGRAARRPCVPHGSKTIARDRSVRVYSIPGYVEGVRQEHAGLYACLLRTAVTVALRPPAQRFPVHLLSNFTVAGTMLAYTDDSHGVDSGCTAIVVLDIASDRRLLRTEAGCFVDAGFIRLADVLKLLVNEHGSIAWVIATGSRSAQTLEVHRATPSGPTTLLDAGNGIVPGSLERASGGEITWVDASGRRYAALP
jgi:hypothetical protein